MSAPFLGFRTNKCLLIFYAGEAHGLPPVGLVLFDG
jgi:hypothetical protein